MIAHEINGKKNSNVANNSRNGSAAMNLLGYVNELVAISTDVKIPYLGIGILFKKIGLAVHFI